MDMDEIAAYLDARYIGPTEAAWRLYSYPIQGRSHPVYKMQLHLPNRQQVFFNAGELNASPDDLVFKDTMLTSYFKLNASDPDARRLLYHEIPEWYTWDVATKLWKKRIYDTSKTIGRMVYINPRDQETWALRLLLLHVRGAKSFDDLKTVDNIVSSTFMDAVRRRNLLEDDGQYIQSMEEAVHFQMPIELRMLFALILLFSEIKNPLSLWERFKSDLSEDYAMDHISEVAIALAYKQIDKILNKNGKQLERDYGILAPIAVIPDIPISVENNGNDINVGRNMYSRANQEQKMIMDSVLAALENP